MAQPTTAPRFTMVNRRALEPRQAIPSFVSSILNGGGNGNGNGNNGNGNGNGGNNGDDDATTATTATTAP